MYVHLIFFVFQVQALFFEVRGNEEDVVVFFTNALQCIERLQREESDNFHQERLYRELNEHTVHVNHLSMCSVFCELKFC